MNFYGGRIFKTIKYLNDYAKQTDKNNFGEALTKIYRATEDNEKYNCVIVSERRRKYISHK